MATLERKDVRHLYEHVDLEYRTKAGTTKDINIIFNYYLRKR